MKHRHFNPLCLLSLVALVGFLAIPTGNTGLWGFGGFWYYARYWFVEPDELFYQNLGRAATGAFLCQMVSLPVFLVGCWLRLGAGEMMAPAFGLSYAVGIFVFSIWMMVLEWRESQVAAND